MNCYFDTNIFNKIFDNPNRDLIVKKIKKKGLIPIPSALNLCELLSTSNEKRKSDLINIYHTIRDDYFPLKPYPWLLREFIEAVEQGIDEINVNHHIEISKFTEEICKEITSTQGLGLEKSIQGARKYVQENRGKIEITDEKSYFEYVDSHIDFSISIFNSFCDSTGIKHNLKREQIIGIIKSPSMPWLYLLDAFFYIFYRRALKMEGYSKESNPESTDLEQSSYLFWVSLFVTHDKDFYGFMKELKELRNYNQDIMNYDEFMDYLGLANQIKKSK